LVYYIIVIGGTPSQNTILAFVASFLSVTASLLSYFVDSKSDDMIPVKYYIELKVDRSDKTKLKGPAHLESPLSSNKEDKTPTGLFDVALSIDNLTDKEKHNFSEYRGLRFGLRNQLTALFQIPKSSIEIGNSILTNQGCITHVIQSVYQDNLIRYDNSSGDSNQMTIKPIDYVEHFYISFKRDIENIFNEMFRLNHPKLGIKDHYTRTIQFIFHKTYESINQIKRETNGNNNNSMDGDMKQTGQIEMGELNNNNDNNDLQENYKQKCKELKE